MTRGPSRTVVLPAALCIIGALCIGQAGWIHAKAWLAQRLIVDAFDRAVAGEPAPRPWPWADTEPVARLHLPGTADPLVVLSGASGRNLAFGPTHDPSSVRPGEPGNSIFAGHRDTHFAPLAGVSLGDTLLVERVDGRQARFTVRALDIVDSRRWRIRLDADQPMLLLVTCYPFDAVDPSGPLRFVVTAESSGEL
ncbi:class GN sortase [Wenzhouxiangella sp. XN24]|uniref:class GN sortase n=1 Tax=Wenzhouxiangella sp. XN24 TaxID=2713569 RepID=UPI0013EB1392|nr:class GN sortase [Wenzhouxiangella sp. XN24]NGX15353.1 class GN sortase [Wenzhouxiangella sp. XN24]